MRDKDARDGVFGIDEVVEEVVGHSVEGLVDEDEFEVA